LTPTTNNMSHLTTKYAATFDSLGGICTGDVRVYVSRDRKMATVHRNRPVALSKQSASSIKTLGVVKLNTTIDAFAALNRALRVLGDNSKDDDDGTIEFDNELSTDTSSASKAEKHDIPLVVPHDTAIRLLKIQRAVLRACINTFTKLVTKADEHPMLWNALSSTSEPLTFEQASFANSLASSATLLTLAIVRTELCLRGIPEDRSDEYAYLLKRGHLIDEDCSKMYVEEEALRLQSLTDDYSDEDDTNMDNDASAVGYGSNAGAKNDCLATDEAIFPPLD